MKHNITFSEGMFVYDSLDKERWGLLKKLYENNYLNAQPSNKLRIPKIIHQIWLGSKIPQEYLVLGETWKKYNPDWEYHLWTDSNIKQLKMINQKIFDQTKDWGSKSDILRYEILYQYGGLYVDTDFECLKSFNDIHFLCDFYAGLLLFL